MIVVDTSALVAVVLSEPDANRCMRVLEAAPELMISAGTLAECLIVAGRRGGGAELAGLVEDLGIQVAPVTLKRARQVAQTYERWGKGVHSAGLNLGDCFAYALAQEYACPLLFIGYDFAKTDVAIAGEASTGLA